MRVNYNEEKEMSLEQLSKSLLISLTVPAIMLTSTAFAAEKEMKTTTPVQKIQQERMVTQERPATDILKMSQVIGKTVENAEGTNLGEINDVVIDPSDGSVVYAVVEAGGFLGLGEKFFAIPWRSFQTVADDDDKGEIDRLILNIDKDRLSNAPGFDKDNWPNMADDQWGQTVHSYYDQQDYWKQRQAMRRGDHDAMTKSGAHDSAMTQNMSSVSATIQQVRGNKVELEVPQSMVQDLQAGDRVEVNIKK
jgi:sporulation protein YlmC with PRC-barrel domain